MIYITKYALTRGIIEMNTDEMQDIYMRKGRLYFLDKNRTPCSFAKGEWYTNKSLAITNAEARRQRKIGVLEQQIEMLKSIKFE